MRLHIRKMSNMAFDDLLKDPEIVAIAREAASKWGDPDKTTLDIPMYESYIHVCISETCQELGKRLAHTDEFRELLFQRLAEG